MTEQSLATREIKHRCKQHARVNYNLHPQAPSSTKIANSQRLLWCWLVGRLVMGDEAPDRNSIVSTTAFGALNLSGLSPLLRDGMLLAER